MYCPIFGKRHQLGLGAEGLHRTVWRQMWTSDFSETPQMGCGDFFEQSLGAQPFGETHPFCTFFGSTYGSCRPELQTPSPGLLSICQGEAAPPCPEAPALCYQTPGHWREHSQDCKWRTHQEQFTTGKFPSEERLLSKDCF